MITFSDFKGKPRYAGVHDITVRNVAIYADERIIAEQGSRCVNVRVKNLIDTTLFSDIRIEGFTLNGKFLAFDDITCKVQGNCERIEVLNQKV